MRNVIKPSQYTHVQPRSIKSSKNDDPKSFNLDDENISQSDSVVLSAAFEKAKQIVDAANSYSEQHIKEATERMNLECAQAKQQSHDEAFSKGFSQGKAQGIEEGYKHGFKKGHDEGLQNAIEENKVLVDRLNLTIEALENSKKTLIEREEENLSNLAVEIAELILKKSIEMDKTTIKSIIENIVEENHNKEWIKINISTDVYDALERMNFSKKIKAVSSGVKLYHSKDLSDSDCVIEMVDEVVDASVNTQLSKIKAVLKK